MGISQKSSTSQWYISSFILGSWPVPIMEAVLTTKGGSISV